MTSLAAQHTKRNLTRLCQNYFFTILVSPFRSRASWTDILLKYLNYLIYLK
jgi:hypothetical protein